MRGLTFTSTEISRVSTFMIDIFIYMWARMNTQTRFKICSGTWNQKEVGTLFLPELLNFAHFDRIYLHARVSPHIYFYIK